MLASLYHDTINNNQLYSGSFPGKYINTGPTRATLIKGQIEVFQCSLVARCLNKIFGPMWVSFHLQVFGQSLLGKHWLLFPHKMLEKYLLCRHWAMFIGKILGLKPRFHRKQSRPIFSADFVRLDDFQPIVDSTERSFRPIVNGFKELIIYSKLIILHWLALHPMYGNEKLPGYSLFKDQYVLQISGRSEQYYHQFQNLHLIRFLNHDNIQKF